MNKNAVQLKPQRSKSELSNFYQIKILEMLDFFFFNLLLEFVKSKHQNSLSDGLSSRILEFKITIG